MKLNNKGITLVEIIISVVLISIVLVFLFSLLIQVNNENADNEVKSSYLVNQSTFIKQIEEDFLDYKLVNGANCTYSTTSGETTKDILRLPRLKESKIKCIKFSFDPSSKYTYAYLFLYKRNDDKYILSYYRGDFKQSVELEDFDWDYNSGYATDKKNTTTHKTYSLPIVGPDYNDYSINLSYAE